MANSRRPFRLAIALSVATALLAGAATVAAAQTLEFEITDGVRFTMDVPKGHCQFDPNGHEADKTYFAAMAENQRPDNKLLATFADCAAVNAMRAAYPKGPYPQFERWVQILAPLAGGRIRKLEGSSRADVIEMLAKLEAADRSVSLSHAVRDLELARPGSEETKPIGQLARDQNVLVSGMLARDDDTKRLIAAAVGMTMVGNYVVSVNTFRTYAGRDTYDALVAESREIVGDLITRNERK